ncbi:hypothetical protein ACHAXT_009606 [Thalassiosira profunda]
MAALQAEHHPSPSRGVTWPIATALLQLCMLATTASSFIAPDASAARYHMQLSTQLFVESTSDSGSRREVLQKSLTFGSLLTTAIASPIPIASSAAAKNAKSRTNGYAVQKTEAEWNENLSSMQYFILRQGGTESPYSSILEGEERPGAYICAGCGTPLFDAKQKFHSGTGWPSFATPLMSTSEPSVSNVEMEDVSKMQYQLAGAEVRCQTCGGHLGDVFADGFLFPGTPAFVSGKRYCIDGAALLFVPKEQKSGGGDLEMVRGDLPPKNGGRGPVFPG